MNWVIVIAGVVGLGVALYGLVVLTAHAVRQRRPLNVVLAVAVVVATVVLLLAFGDRLLR